MTRVAIIGCGNISHFHYEGYEHAGAQITHVCDIRREAAEAVAARYGARVSTDYHAVIDDPNVELISVTAISSLHKEIALAAIAAGKGVVCEKTLTDNPADSAIIAQAADEAGAFAATAYMKRFFPAAQQAKALLAEMGDVVSIHARTWQPFGGLWDDEVAEFWTHHPSPVKKNYGGGVLVCGGSHILDLIHWFGGRPSKVCGHMRSRPGMDFDIHDMVMLWLPNEGMATLETHWHPFTQVGYERNGWDERLEINTAKGRLDFYTVLWDHPTNNGALLVHQDAATGRVTEYRYPAMNPFDAEMAEMLRRFAAGEPPTPSAWDGYVVDELLATITASAQQGSILPVEYRDQVRA